MSNDEINRLLELLTEVEQAARAAMKPSASDPTNAAVCALCNKCDITHWGRVLSVDMQPFLQWTEVTARTSEDQSQTDEMVRMWPAAWAALYTLRTSAAALYDSAPTEITPTDGDHKIKPMDSPDATGEAWSPISHVEQEPAPLNDPPAAPATTADYVAKIIREQGPIIGKKIAVELKKVNSPVTEAQVRRILSTRGFKQKHNISNPRDGGGYRIG